MNFKTEQQYKRKGYKVLVGMDEAGRGALAGPIVAGCVHIPFTTLRQARGAWQFVRAIQDSKKLSNAQREKLFTLITKHCSWSVGLVDNVEIDTIGIGKANQLAFVRALEQFSLEPDFAVVDYFKTKLVIPSAGIVKGDAKVISIAAASIVAKVFRDRLMIEYDTKFPQWGFGKHKGYGTKQHIQALMQYGSSMIHRSSYRPVIEVL